MVCFCFIACESAKTEGFLFDSNATTDYLKVEVEGLNKPLVVLTSCTWVKFKDSSPRWEFFFGALLASTYAWAELPTIFW